MREIEFGLGDSNRAEAWLQATLTMRTLDETPFTEDEAAQFRARMRFGMAEIGRRLRGDTHERTALTHPNLLAICACVR